MILKKTMGLSLIIMGIALLFGCSTVDKGPSRSQMLSEVVRSWQGKAVEELVESWGRPDEKSASEYEYEKKQYDAYPGSVINGTDKTNVQFPKKQRVKVLLDKEGNITDFFIYQ